MLKFPASETEWYVCTSTQSIVRKTKKYEIFIMGESDYFAFQNRLELEQ